MEIWLVLRLLATKFKGKRARFILILLVILIVLNFFLLQRGPRSETVKLFGEPKQNNGKAYASTLKAGLREGTSKVTSKDELLSQYSQTRNKKITDTSTDSISVETAENKFTRTEFFAKQGQVDDSYNLVQNTVEKQSIHSTDKSPLANTDENKLPQDSLEQANNSVYGDKQVPGSFCPELFISRSNAKYGMCKPHKPTQEACLYAKSLYFLDQNLTKCKKPLADEICNIQIDYKDSAKSSIHVECDRSLCSKKRYSSSVWTLDSRNGIIRKIKSFYSILDMEKQLPQLIIENLKKEIYFLFVKCIGKKGDERISQLLPIDPRLTIRRHKKTFRPKNAINVNILLLDSVSRSHFYRSLPKTISLFKEWSSSTYSAPAYVFDFELFQAIHGHTAENTHALFTGEPLPPHLEDEYPPVEAGVMFGRFAKAGYQTLWQEDLCWNAVWGLMTDLKVPYWETLTNKLRENFIDSVGITHSSCEVLLSYNIQTPFNDPPGDQICYNGKFQHEYLLNYTLDTLDAIKSSSKALPLISYMSLSVGHDGSGRRIQTFDQSLTEYINKLGRDENTITLVLADHGNTYTEYTVAILEGRYEMFHPSLFIIVPKNVAKLLGNEAMKALRTNQRRLVTMIELHHTLMALAGPFEKGRVAPTGIFTPISLKRTCNDLDLRTPNLCVCDGWDSPTTNDTLKAAHVEFAVGELNNMMNDKFMKGLKGKKKHGYPLLKSCIRLVPVRFENVRERITKKGLLRTTMDIYVKSIKENPGKLEMFHVEIESKETPDSISMDLRLVHFDRMSVFEKYKKCCDAGISPVFCICSTPSTRTQPIDSVKKMINNINESDRFDSFRTKALVQNLDKRKCLFLIKRNHLKQSFSYEFINLCLDTDITLFVDAVDLDNIKLSRKLPMKLTILAGSMQFAFTARNDLSYWNSNIRVVAHIMAQQNRD